MTRTNHLRGFTLVELLVVIMIIALLASMALMALSSTSQSAREARTRGTIAKLHALVMERWDTYQTRRVPINTGSQTNITTINNQKLTGLRQLMRMEMPDRFDDFNNTSGVTVPVPSVAKAYKKNYDKYTSRTADYASAESLYLFVKYGSLQEDALSQFNESEIGDFDNDGMKEFVDGWGQPIMFLRWAPKFDSSIIIQDPVNHHDPFDMNKVSPNAYALYPVIFSFGPDKLGGINVKGRTVAESQSPDDPYVGNIGAPDPTGNTDYIDNITNLELLTPN
jgi:prepilin-type N-terminal cleavage/methylation domain-containing protein